MSDSNSRNSSFSRTCAALYCAHGRGVVGFFGFAGMGIGIATTLLATGLAGIAHAVVPRWFAILTLVLGVLSALGTAGIPPGGLVNYLLLPFWLIGWGADAAGGWLRTLLQYLSIIEHMDSFGKGVIDTKDVVYYVTVIAFALFLTLRALDAKRWKG